MTKTGKTAKVAPRRPQAGRLPLRPLRRQVLPVLLAADRHPDHLGRLRRDPLVPRPRPDARLRRQGDLAPPRRHPLQVPPPRQPLRDLPEPPQDLPGIHDRRLRIRHRLDVFEKVFETPEQIWEYAEAVLPPRRRQEAGRAGAAGRHDRRDHPQMTQMDADEDESRLTDFDPSASSADVPVWEAPMIDAHIHAVHDHVPGDKPVGPGRGRPGRPARRRGRAAPRRDEGRRDDPRPGDGPARRPGRRPARDQRHAPARRAGPGPPRHRHRRPDQDPGGRPRPLQEGRGRHRRRQGRRPEGVHRLPPLRPRQPGLSPLHPAGGAVQDPVRLPHRRHLVDPGEAPVRPPAPGRRRGGRPPRRQVRDRPLRQPLADRRRRGRLQERERLGRPLRHPRRQRRGVRDSRPTASPPPTRTGP